MEFWSWPGERAHVKFGEELLRLGLEVDLSGPKRRIAVTIVTIAV